MIVTAQQHFVNVPLALLPERAALLLEAIKSSDLGEFAPFHARRDAAPAAALGQDAYTRDEQRPYSVIDGIAIIVVRGILVHQRTWWFDDTCYADIRRAFVMALDDAEVRAIVLHVNSPGGVVSGCFDLADLIFVNRGKKPIWSILDEHAYSAAYALGCAADRIIVPRTGGTGSIGVIMLRIDVTGALEKFGVKVETIKFGAQKDDYYPTTPLSKEARDRMQTEVDSLGEMFVDMVARNRKMTASSVRKTEAGIFLGSAGVDQGLADAVMSPDEAFIALRDKIS